MNAEFFGGQSIEEDFEGRLNSFVFKCKELLIDATSLAEEAESTLAWIRLFDSLNVALSDIVREHAKLNSVRDGWFISRHVDEEEDNGCKSACDDTLSTALPVFESRRREDDDSSPIACGSDCSAANFPKPRPIRLQSSTKRRLNLNRALVKLRKKHRGRRMFSKSRLQKKKTGLKRGPYQRRAEKNMKATNCPYCGVLYTRNKELEIHVRQHELAFERAIFPFVRCAVCDHRAKDKRCLRIHFTLVHAKKEPLPVESTFLCEICSARLKTMDYLKRHMLQHVEERNFVCDCGYRTTTSMLLARHKWIHGGRDIACPVEGCSCVFKTRQSMRMHVKRVHKDIRERVCEVCGKRFRDNKDLVVHMRSHTGERRFMCYVCGNLFSKFYNMKHHVITTHKLEFNASITEGNSAYRVFEHLIAPAKAPNPVRHRIRQPKDANRQISQSKEAKRLISQSETPKPSSSSHVTVASKVEPPPNCTSVSRTTESDYFPSGVQANPIAGTSANSVALNLANQIAPTHSQLTNHISAANAALLSHDAPHNDLNVFYQNQMGYYMATPDYDTQRILTPAEFNKYWR